MITPTTLGNAVARRRRMITSMPHQQPKRRVFPGVVMRRAVRCGLQTAAARWFAAEGADSSIALRSRHSAVAAGTIAGNRDDGFVQALPSDSILPPIDPK